MKNKEITESIIGAAIEVHNILGPGLLEKIYEDALAEEFRIRKIKFKQQCPIDVIYKSKVIKGQLVDLLVEERVIVELKALSSLPEVAKAQTLSYLYATKLETALLINFGTSKLIDGIKRFSI